MSLSTLRELYPWPAERPAVEQRMNDGWFCGQNMQMLREASPIIAVEIGSWLGMSTRFLCDIADVVIAIDHWKGSIEHTINPEWAERLPTLYETFLTNCWSYKDKLTPVRETSLRGLEVVKENGIVPDLIYLDAAHDADSVETDLSKCLELFPSTRVVGDDWSWHSVREGVMRTLAKEPFFTYDLRSHQTCYEVYKC